MTTRSAFRIFTFAIASVVLAPRASTALEATLFVSGASPSELWSGGVGGALSLGLFDVAGVEVEGAHQSLEGGGAGILTLSGRAFLAPSIGRLVPYVGLSAGVRRETAISESDWGTTTGVFVGAKLKLPLGLRLRAEYQWVHLPQEVLIPMDGRYYGGIGLAF
jgi:hypothetical protein